MRRRFSGAARLLGASAAIAGVLVAAALAFGPRLVAGRLNPVLPAPAGPPPERARALHEALRVVDLHADVLLWDRPIAERSPVGHADLPRLVEGRVALQAFTVVTRTPWGINVEENRDDSDQILALALLQLWPPATWTSATERALHQAERLHRIAAGSAGRLTVVRTREDLPDLDAEGNAEGDAEGRVAALLGIEGGHALEGELANLDRLFEAGFRMLGLVHFFDDEIGGSAHGVLEGGLTAFGREVLARMRGLGMVPDLAHASAALLEDVVAAGGGPVVISHTGVDGTCPGPRNLSDAQLRAVAGTGGVIGIGLWPGAVCGETPEAWARAVRHAAEVVGPEHVALGSDWDGAVPAIVDAAGTVHLTAALIEAGFSDEEVRGIMGGNALRVLRAVLPSGRKEPRPRGGTAGTAADATGDGTAASATTDPASGGATALDRTGVHAGEDPGEGAGR